MRLRGILQKMDKRLDLKVETIGSMCNQGGKRDEGPTNNYINSRKPERLTELQNWKRNVEVKDYLTRTYDIAMANIFV